MAPEAIRPTEEGMGTEGLFQTQGIGLTEGLGIVEGVPAKAASRAAAPSAAPPKRTVLSAMPTMRSAVIWSEILGKPKALRGRK